MDLPSLVEKLSKEETFVSLHESCKRNFGQLGMGATRVVYKTTLDGGIPVVIKIVHGKAWTGANDKEVRIYQKTNGNIHLAKVLASKQTRNNAWIVAEFIPKLFTNIQAHLIQDCAYYGNKKPPEKYESFVSFLVEQKLNNDLHRKNLGFRADKTPVILDYGS